jgi:hypothetical protein
LRVKKVKNKIKKKILSSCRLEKGAMKNGINLAKGSINSGISLAKGAVDSGASLVAGTVRNFKNGILPRDRSTPPYIARIV